MPLLMSFVISSQSVQAKYFYNFASAVYKSGDILEQSNAEYSDAKSFKIKYEKYKFYRCRPSRCYARSK